MSSESTGIRFHANALHGAEHRLEAGLTIEGPFTMNKVVLKFPRWVPGSYFLREPIQHMFDFTAQDQSGKELKWKRVGVDAISVNLGRQSSTLRVQYSLLAK